VENIVWEKVKEILENPQTILAEMKRQADEQHGQAGEGFALDKAISKVRRQLRNYEYQEKRLIKLFRHDEIAEDFILDEINQLKKDHQVDEEKLASLCQTKEQITKLVNAEIKLNEFCARVSQNLDKCTFKDKRLALDTLDVKVITTPDRVEVQGVIPIDLVTIEQTSAC